MTSSRKQLLHDLEFGKVEGEEPVRRLLLDTFGAVCENVGDRRLGWDLQISGFDGSKLGLSDAEERKVFANFTKRFGSTIEVKRDKTSDRTGNLYWEVWSNKRLFNAGCIFESKADTIVYVRKTEFVFLNRAKLLSWFFESTFLRDEASEVCRSKTFRGNRERLMTAANNRDVEGILLPVELVKDSPACFYIVAR